MIKLQKYVSLCIILFSVFFTQCDSDNNISLVLVSPAEGTVINEATATIKVRVNDPDNMILSIKGPNKETISYNKDTGEFDYTVPMKTDSIYTTCEFKITTRLYKTIISRFSLAHGISLTEGSQIPNALNATLAPGGIRKIQEKLNEVVNTYKNDFLFGKMSDKGSKDPNSPFKDQGIIPMDYSFPTFKVSFITIRNNHGTITNGSIENFEAVVVLPSTDNTALRADVTLKKLWVYATHHCSAKRHNDFPFPDVALGSYENHVSVTTDITIKNCLISLTNSEDNKIYLGLDLSQSQIEISNLVAKYDFEGSFIDNVLNVVHKKDNVEDAIENKLREKINELVKSFSIKMKLVNTDDLVISASGVSLYPSFTSSEVFKTSPSGINFDLGMRTSLAEGMTPVNEDLAAIYSTPNDLTPVLTTESATDAFNVMLSDDLLNSILFTGFQAGLMSEIDVTEPINNFLSEQKVSVKDLKATLNVNVPPIADLADSSGAQQPYLGKIEIPNITLTLVSGTDETSPSLTLSIDVNALLSLTKSDDGKVLGLRIDKEKSNCTIKVIDENKTIINSALVPVIGKTITNEAIDTIIQKVIKINVSDLLQVDPMVPMVSLDYNAYLMNRYIIISAELLE